MATAVLDETDVLLDDEAILGTERNPETENVFEWLANRYRALGYDAMYVANEDDNDFDWDKYMEEKTQARKLLNA